MHVLLLTEGTNILWLWSTVTSVLRAEGFSSQQMHAITFRLVTCNACGIKDENLHYALTQ